MALKYINTETVQSTRTYGNPVINFSKSGVVGITMAAWKALNVKVGDKIAFAIDDEDCRKLYVYVDKSYGFEIRGSKKISSTNYYLRIYNKSLCLKMLEGYPKYDKIECRLIMEKGLVDGKNAHILILPKIE